MNNPRATMPEGLYASMNPEMATEISNNPVFASLAAQLANERDIAAMKYSFIYGIADDIAGQTTLPFTLTIEQGSDFKCEWITASAFSYDDANASDFPIPNSAGLTRWAGRGLSFMITDTRSGRDLTSDFIPFELMATPGYGMNFQYPYPFRYLFQRNAKVRFDVRNRDNATRTHAFSIGLLGHKVLTPQ